jgi:hypothetical protein
MARPIVDSTSGQESREQGIDPILGRPGSAQFLGDVAAHHDDSSVNIIVAESNRVQGGLLPRWTEPVGRPSAADPVGVGRQSEEE